MFGPDTPLALRLPPAALGGADTITVGDLSGTSVKQVAINLAATGGMGDAQSDTVIVNGTAVVDDGLHTGATPGRALRRGRSR